MNSLCDVHRDDYDDEGGFGGYGGLVGTSTLR